MSYSETDGRNTYNYDDFGYLISIEWSERCSECGGYARHWVLADNTAAGWRCPTCGAGDMI